MSLFVLLFLYLLPSCFATLYDPFTNVAFNNDTSWAFGSYDSPSTPNVGIFTKYSFIAPYTFGGGLLAWVGTPSFGYPCLFFNPNETNTTNSVTFEPYQMALHPGFYGERSGVRFTAPETTCNVYEINYAFWGKEKSTTSDIAISYKGQNLVYSEITYSSSAVATKTRCLKMQKGDILDVSLGYGSNSAYSSDTTAIVLTLNSTCYASCEQYSCVGTNKCNGRGTCNADGSCQCSPSFTSASNCVQCSAGYYPTNSCTKMCIESTTCNGKGTCDAAGNCVCKFPFTGPNCNKCVANVYPDGICNRYCDADIVCAGVGVCNASGLCECAGSYPSGTCVPATPQTNIMDNNNAEWRFGYFPSNNTPTAVATFVPATDFRAWDVNLYAWNDGTGTPPLVATNPNFTTQVAMPMNVPFAPQRIGFHPGPKGERAAVRFIATQRVCNVYQLYHAFWGLENGGSSDVVITYKGKVVYSLPNISYTTVIPAASALTCMKMEVGEMLDVSVGYGNDHQYYGDVTGIKMFVEAVCAPSCEAVQCIKNQKCKHGQCTETGQCQCDVGWDGANCDVCASSYYPTGSCNIYCNATETCNGFGECNSLGQCVCDDSHKGNSTCNKCSANRYGYPACTYCLANETCSGYGTCNEMGQCDCRTSHNGSAACNKCGVDRFSYPICTYCEKSATCRSNGECTSNGKCNCTTGFSGDFCDGCSVNHFSYPTCNWTNVCLKDCTRNDTCSGHGNCNNFGQCDCDYGFAGASCNNCSADHYNYPSCIQCTRESTCGGFGSCNDTGGCKCDDNREGEFCGGCGPNSYNYPECTYCTRSENCTNHGSCSTNGTCFCDGGFSGVNCTLCATNYYNYPSCTFCTRNNTCHTHGSCETGTCACDDGFDVNFNCGRCSVDHYNYPTCVECTRNGTCGGNGKCNDFGKCECDNGFVGESCNKCANDYYNYPSCIHCTRDTCNGQGSCTVNGTCLCEDGYAGATCNGCSEEHFDYPNCQYCNATVSCFEHGSCNQLGQCDCETKFNGSQSCNLCSADHYNYPLCEYCLSEDTCGSYGECNSLGQCECNTGYNSSDCGSCDYDYYSFPSCIYCEASLNCSGYGTCNSNGLCDCFNNHNGNSNCSKCSADHYDFPYCKFCTRDNTCNGNGNCNGTGLCECDSLYSGAACDECSQPGLMYPVCAGSNETTTTTGATTEIGSTSSTTSSATTGSTSTNSSDTASITTSTTSSTTTTTTTSSTTGTTTSTSSTSSTSVSSTTSASTTTSTSGGPQPQVPSSPLSLQASSVTRTSIVIQWQAPGNIGSSSVVSYSLQQSTSLTGGWTKVYQGDQLQTTVVGLTPGTMYFYQIAAANNAGLGEYSASINATTKALSVPSQARTITQVENSRDAIVVQWLAADDDGGSPITHHILLFSSDSTFWHNISVISPQLTYAIRNLKARQQYSIQVASVNIVGVGQFSNVADFSTLEESCGDRVCDHETYYSEDCSSCAADCAVCTYPVCPGATECSGRGTCMKGVCNCQKGWTNQDCSVPDSSSLPIDVVVNPTTPTVTIGVSDKSISFGLSFSDIQEVTKDGSIIF